MVCNECLKVFQSRATGLVQDWDFFLKSNCYFRFICIIVLAADLGRKWKTVAIDVNESILSLLMKLHAKLSGKTNSYVPESETSGPATATDSRYAFLLLIIIIN